MSNLTFPGILWKTHGKNGLKFDMLMYPDHLQNWLDFDHGDLPNSFHVGGVRRHHPHNAVAVMTLTAIWPDAIYTYIICQISLSDITEVLVQMRCSLQVCVQTVCHGLVSSFYITHWGLNKIVNNLQTTILVNTLLFYLKLHWRFCPNVQ